ncbi:MAG: protein kinase [bacterium]
MTTPKTTVKTKSGHTIRIEEYIQAGVQGRIARACDLDTRQEVAVKVFHPDHSNADIIARTDFLCDQKLSEACPVLVSPVELIADKKIVGYTMNLINGIPLQEFIETKRTTFMQNLVGLAVIVHGFSKLHSRKISHGDIRAANVLVTLDGPVPQLRIIDFDNFSAPGVPKPTCLGDEMYLAPELYRSVLAGKPASPGIGSDLYSIRIMAEEILTLRHPSAGFLEPEEMFVKSMYDQWFHDPALPPVRGVGGYPARILNARLANLFRRGMSGDPDKRPSAVEWLDELLTSLGEVYICPQDNCGCPCMADTSKLLCPLCGKPYPTLSLALLDGSKIPIISGFMQLGRNELRMSNSVSAIHAILRKVGPAVTLESYGRNGTYRKTGNSWDRLEDQKPIVISKGDVLRFADVEAKVE